MFIALEGIDGSGTTTQAATLAEKLRELYPNREVVLTREPSDTPVTQLIRQWLRADEPPPPRALATAFVLDRYIHLANVVKPALGRGAIVVCDRYLLSTLAYQGKACGYDWVAAVTAGTPEPDLYLYLSVDVEAAAERVRSRGTPPDHYERDVEFQAAVAAEYDVLVARRPDLCVTVATHGRTATQVAESVLQAVRERAHES